MSAYDKDPRVRVRYSGAINVTDRWNVLKNDLGEWNAHDAIDEKTSHGMPVAWVSPRDDPDDVIYQLIGDPQ